MSKVTTYLDLLEYHEDLTDKLLEAGVFDQEDVAAISYRTLAPNNDPAFGLVPDYTEEQWCKLALWQQKLHRELDPNSPEFFAAQREQFVLFYDEDSEAVQDLDIAAAKEPRPKPKPQVRQTPAADDTSLEILEDQELEDRKKLGEHLRHLKKVIRG